jgi:integral membrane sensor domain MASE1
VNTGDHDNLISLRYAAGVGLLTAIYVLAAWLGFTAAAMHPPVSSAWPPAGVALAAMLLFGKRFWPGIVLGTFIANVAMGVSPLGAAAMAAGNVLEAMVAARVFAAFAGSRLSLDRLRDVCGLMAGAILGAPLSATIGVAALALSGGPHSTPYWTIWLTWLSGDVIGILLVTPFILVWATAHRPRFDARKALEACVLAAVVFSFAAVFFRAHVSYVYAIFPATLWAALRFGPRGAATASFVVAVLANAYTVREVGPWASGSPLNDLSRLQIFLCVLALTQMIVAAVKAELEWSLDDARRARSELSREHAAYETLQQLAQREAVKAKWLEGVAETTTALAHELNNPLTSLMMNVEELEHAHPSEAPELIAEIQKAANRIAATIKRLTTLSPARSVAYVGKSRMLDLSHDR